MMILGQAIEQLKLGAKVTRACWRNKERFIYLVNGQHVNFENLRNESAKALDADNAHNAGKTATIQSRIDMRLDNNAIVIGWSPSQSELLAEDWEVVR